MFPFPVRIIEKKAITSSGIASISFTDIDKKIPSWAKHLVIYWSASSNSFGTKLKVRINADAASNYNYVYGIQQASPSRVSVSPDSYLDISGALIRTSVSVSLQTKVFPNGWLLFPETFRPTTDGVYRHGLYQTIGVDREFLLGSFYKTAATPSETLTKLEFYVDDTGAVFMPGSEFWLGVIDETYAIDHQKLSANAASITIANIPTSLQLGDMLLIGSIAGTSGTNPALNQTINADATASNYSRELIKTDSGTTFAASSSGSDQEIGKSLNSSSIYTAIAHTYKQPRRDNYKQASFGMSTDTTEAYIHLSTYEITDDLSSLSFAFGTGNIRQLSSLSMYWLPKRRISYSAIGVDTEPLSIATSEMDNYCAAHIGIVARSSIGSATEGLSIRLNGKASTQFAATYIRVNGSTITRTASAVDSIGHIPAGSATANLLGVGCLTIFSPYSASKLKRGIGFISAGLTDFYISIWEDDSLETPVSTTAIDFILPTGNFVAYQTLLYLALATSLFDFSRPSTTPTVIGMQKWLEAIAADMSHIAVGTGTATPTPYDSQLATETNRLAVTTKIRSGLAAESRVTFHNSDLPSTTEELGLFLNGSGAANSGSILLRGLSNFSKGTQKDLGLSGELQLYLE